MPGIEKILTGSPRKDNSQHSLSIKDKWHLEAIELLNITELKINCNGSWKLLVFESTESDAATLRGSGRWGLWTRYNVSGFLRLLCKSVRTFCGSDCKQNLFNSMPQIATNSRGTYPMFYSQNNIHVHTTIKHSFCLMTQRGGFISQMCNTAVWALIGWLGVNWNDYQFWLARNGTKLNEM